MFADVHMLVNKEYIDNFNSPKWPTWYLAVMKWKLILEVMVLSSVFSSSKIPAEIVTEASGEDIFGYL